MPRIDVSDHPTDKDETHLTGEAPDRGQEIIMKLQKTMASIRGNAISSPCSCLQAHFTFLWEYFQQQDQDLDFPVPKDGFSNAVFGHKERSKPDGKDLHQRDSFCAAQHSQIVQLSPTILHLKVMINKCK